MPVLPQLKAMFEATQKNTAFPMDVPPAQLRSGIHAMMENSYLAFSSPHSKVAMERDVLIPVNGSEVTVRLYRTTENEQPTPCHVYYHGGGFFVGTLDYNDGICRALATMLKCVVASVDYRLAPEHKFPAAPDDSYAALCWIAENASQLAIDPTRISVGGRSAGGNLAAVVSQMVRDRGGPQIVAQVLEIPVTDFTSKRVLDFPDENISIGAEKEYAPLYLRNPADARDPRASPLLASSLSGLPKALIMCAEYDQLQPEGEAYATRLNDAGVSATYRCWPGQFHGSQGFDKLIPEEVARYDDEIVAFLREAYS